MTEENLYYLLENIDRVSKTKGKDTYLRAPFGYPGGKSRSLEQVLPRLPVLRSYVEPFGGSGVVLLNRPVSQLEVFNDRYAGVVAFYQCVRDHLDALVDRLDLTVDAREEWIWAADSWKDLANDPVERAARWYYMHCYSFSNKGRCWGRQTNSKGMAGKIRDKIHLFPEIHQRFRKVQIENQDWREILKDYASEKTVFYLDPPYYYDVSFSKIYDHGMLREDHEELLAMIKETPGFFAVSGYPSELYDKQDFWTGRHQWGTYVSVGGNAYTEGNKKIGGKSANKRATEVLWLCDNT
jgi:DNA adenine methylase